MSESPFKMKGFSGFGNSPLRQEESIKTIPRLGLQKLPVKSSSYKPTKTSNPADWKQQMALTTATHPSMQELEIRKRIKNKDK